MRCRAAVAGALVVALACGPPRLPSPPYTSHPASALVEIPYPPPPARVETVPLRPLRSGVVWIDGEWSWQARRWAWKPGRWVIPPPNARFAPWTTVRDRVGTLYQATGTWRGPSGEEVPAPEPLAVASPAPAAIITPEGAEIRQGPLLQLDAGAREARDASAIEVIEERDGNHTSPLDYTELDAGSEP